MTSIHDACICGFPRVGIGYHWTINWIPHACSQHLIWNYEIMMQYVYIRESVWDKTDNCGSNNHLSGATVAAVLIVTSRIVRSASCGFHSAVATEA